MPERRYPSKNTIRLQAEIERDIRSKTEWFQTTDGRLILAVGLLTWSEPCSVDAGLADIDAAKRKLLVELRQTLTASGLIVGDDAV